MKINKQKIDEYVGLLSDVRVLGLLAFCVVVLLVSLSSIKVLQTNFELQKKENELVKVNQIKKLENENLKLKNVYFESDDYLELTARRQFNRALPGEKLYLIPKSVALANTKDLDTKKVTSNSKSPKTKSSYMQNLEDWKSFFLHQAQKTD